MERVNQLFMRGLIAVLPISITLFLLVWLVSTAETFFGGLLQLLVPADDYIPGMGILAGFVLIFAVGILLQGYLFRRLSGVFDGLVERIPFVKTVYSSMRDVSKFVSAAQEGGDSTLQSAVLVKFADGLRVMGFITDRSVEVGDGSSRMAVYIPMSYQIGGFTVLLSEDDVEQIDLSVQEAMQFVLTAGMTSHKN